MWSERLHFELKRLEIVHQEHRGYEYKISKYTSLKRIDPFVLLTFRETGSRDFRVSEAQIDMDFPGHYLRRVKSVSLTIPCIVGPYTIINCTYV